MRTIRSIAVTSTTKRSGFILFFAVFFSFCGKSQDIAVKSNILYDATTTLNFGLEVGVAPKWTLELPVNYNPWLFANDAKLKHWGLQPEARRWFCERFMGHFLGIHGIVAGYNVGGLNLLGLKDYRYEGYLYGGGVSYGYQRVLSKRWSIEATVGVGVVFMDHAKYPCEKCAEKIGDYTKTWFGPTKAGISIVYIIK